MSSDSSLVNSAETDMADEDDWMGDDGSTVNGSMVGFRRGPGVRRELATYRTAEDRTVGPLYLVGTRTSQPPTDVYQSRTKIRTIPT